MIWRRPTGRWGHSGAAGAGGGTGAFIDRTVTMAQTNAAKIPESQRLKVLFGTGSTGLACNAAGSVQADVIDLVGAVNAIIPEEVTNRGGGTTVSLEEYTPWSRMLFCCPPAAPTIP